MRRSWESRKLNDPRTAAIPDVHSHAKGEHRPYAEERPISYSPRMLFLWFYHACRRQHPRFLMVADHVNYLTFEDPGAVNTVRRALKLAHAGDLYGAAETAGVDVAHAAVVSEGLRRGMRLSIGAEVDNDPRSRPDAQNIVDAMRPDGIIRSVHFLNVDHPEKGADWSWAFDKAEFVAMFEHVGVDKMWQLYMARLLEDVEKLPGHIVGHFYGPAQFGHWPSAGELERYEDQILEAARARGMAIEINTRFLYRDHPDGEKARFLAANKRLAAKARAAGVPIAIGSSAHSPRDQGGAFDRVLAILDELDINEIVFPVGGSLRRVALRATKENLEAQSRTREPLSPGSSIIGLGRAELGLPEEPDKAELAKRELARTGRGAAKKRTTGPGARRQAARHAGCGEKAGRNVAPLGRLGRIVHQSEGGEGRAEGAHGQEGRCETGRPTEESGRNGKTVKKRRPAKRPLPHLNRSRRLRLRRPRPKKATPAKKSAPAKKATAKKTAPVKKALPKASASKKTSAKAVAKKTPAKKAVPVKAAPARKATAKKAAPAKKTMPARKAPAPKPPVKKPAPKKAAAKAAPAKESQTEEVRDQASLI